LSGFAAGGIDFSSATGTPWRVIITPSPLARDQSRKFIPCYRNTQIEKLPFDAFFAFGVCPATEKT
jgi:hypothetical protein